MSGMDPRQRMDPRLIKEISNEIGSERRMLGIYLGFKMAQLERLRDAHRNMGDQIFAMLNAWHDVVVLCGENPRHLLAAALQDCENSNLAVTKLVTPKELDGLKPKEREPREETKRQIEQINFSVPGDTAGSVNNYGATGSVNVFPGATFINNADLSLGSDYLGPTGLLSDQGLRRVAVELGAEWKTVAIELGLKQAALEQIQTGNPHEKLERHIFLALIKWRDEIRHATEDASGINELLEAIINAGRVDLAQDLIEKLLCVSRSSGADSLPSNPKYGQFKKSHDDSLTQTMAGIYHNMMGSVGAIMTHNYVIGTGFRVGSKYITTARHVITNILDPNKTGAISEQYLQDAYISFSDMPTVPSAVTYKFEKVVYSNEKLDIAILEILNPDQRLPKKLLLQSESFSDIKYVSLLGYGHPNNHGKHWEPRCPIINPHFEYLRSALALTMQQHQDFIRNLDYNHVLRTRSQNQNPAAVVEKGYLGYDEPHKLLIHAFLQDGASGSPMLACVNSAAGIVQVVGVFTHGIPEFYFCLNATGKSMIPNEFRFEAGARMTFICQDICRENISLARDIFS